MTALDSGNAVVGSRHDTRVAKPGDQAAIIEASQCRMRFSRRSKIRFHSKMNLHRPALKPTPTAFRQLRRLGNFLHPQQVRVKHSSTLLAAWGHSELNMINRAEGIGTHSAPKYRQHRFSRKLEDTAAMLRARQPFPTATYKCEIANRSLLHRDHLPSSQIVIDRLLPSSHLGLKPASIIALHQVIAFG